MSLSTGRVINFSSENFTGVHEKIMNALVQANFGTVPSYGNDSYTEKAINILKDHFGNEIDVSFTFNGTGANNFGLGCVVQSYQSIFCSDLAHLYVNESCAPEAFIGCRIYPVRSLHGKIIIECLRESIKKLNSIHHPQPKVVSITQPTECGTVYSIQELQNIKEICNENNMLFHVDGTRFFNAAVYLNQSLENISKEVGVDILTLGGTKNGMMFGEAVIFFNLPQTGGFRYHLKRSMQLASKNRFIAAQFIALFKDELWMDIATHTNLLAKRVEARLAKVPAIKIAYPVESNVVFAELPLHLQSTLRQKAGFYVWDEQKNIYRFVFSFDNTIEEVDFFIDRL
ncbi:MAG: aminotransferase class I/II-fold pyridoxal phosphate-dependent enzyme [Chitinophagaceae bacterium]